MKIMMFAHDGSLNRGCEAIVRSTDKMIKERLPGTKTYLVSGKPETDKILMNLDGILDGSKIKIKKYSFDWLISSLQLKVLNKDSYALGRIERNIIKHIDDMDIFLSIGGDNYCYGEQPGWYEVDKRIKGKGKKLILWGCSIGIEDMSERKFEDLKNFDLILARETITYNMLKEHGLNNVRLSADPAFTMEREDLQLPTEWVEGKTIGLNFSPLVEKVNKESRNALKNLIQHIIDTTDYKIALTPHVMQEGNNDFEILNSFYQEFKDTKRIFILPENLTAPQYKGFIARMKFFIGARTHSTIAAYSSYVPALVLGYSVKSKGIAKDLFEEEKLVLGPMEISDTQKLISNFNEMVEDELAIKKQLYFSIPKIKSMSYKGVDYLYELGKS